MRNYTRYCVLVVLVSALAVGGPWPSGARPIIILPSSAPTAAPKGAGTLVDGTGREPLAGATIVVRDGRVAEVTAGSVATLPAGTEGIDARAKWIVPGLIDMHVHYYPGWMDALFLRHGVTTVRDAAGSPPSSSCARRVGPRASRVPGSLRAGR